MIDDVRFSKVHNMAHWRNLAAATQRGVGAEGTQHGIKFEFLRRMQSLGGPQKRGRNKQAHQLKTYSPTTAS